MKISHLKKSDLPVQRWKNGLGVTREIARDSSNPFLWRVSWAEVPESGPFSEYPGYDRTLVLLDGGPVRLRHDDLSVDLKRLSPHRFKGEAKTEAMVSSPAEDFNLFIRRDGARGAIYDTHLPEGAESQLPLNGLEHFFFLVSGKVEAFDPNESRSYSLAAGDVLRASRRTPKERLNLRLMSPERDAEGLWIVIHAPR